MVLRVDHRNEEPTVSSVSAFLRRNPGIKSLEWRACEHDSWFTRNRPLLQKALSEHGVMMLQDDLICVSRCESQSNTHNAG